MRVLLLSHAFNSLTQRLYVALSQEGHSISVEFDINDDVTTEAVSLFEPDVIVAPFLKRAIPESIWRNHVCLVVHPGIPGDRGPSSLDWAIHQDETQWGVTVLQANGEMDAGDIWASAVFDMRDATKASLYRNEVTESALSAVLQAVTRFRSGDYVPQPQNLDDPSLRGTLRPLMRQPDRSIDWARDDTATVLRRVRAADGFPGVRDSMFGREVYLYDAHAEDELSGAPGTVIARCAGAVCRCTVDGAVWIGHLMDKHGRHPFKLPATHLLKEEVSHLPEVGACPSSGYRDIWFEREGDVAYLHFPFYNGAMGTKQCERLRQAYLELRRSDARVIVLLGGPDFWSNGMHLNLIEAADSPADESWRNINAIDDLARDIIETTSQITVAALRGNAGAGGVFLARAADQVWAHPGVILNPHYKDMGNLYGSEYWTYLLPSAATEIVKARLPMGSRQALALGLIDDRLEVDNAGFPDEVASRAQGIASAAEYSDLLEKKAARRDADETNKPLERYRAHELEKMKLNFYGFDPSYHVARYNFVYKVPKSRTPLTIARHRRTGSGQAPTRKVS